MADISYKQNGDRFLKIVDDGENSATFYIDATDTNFKGVGITDEDTSGYDDLEEEEWMDLYESYKEAIDDLEFVGGYPPHMPQPKVPK